MPYLGGPDLNGIGIGAQVAVNLFSVLFGTSMLVSGILPGTVVGVILALNGATLLYLLRLLVVIDGIKTAR